MNQSEEHLKQLTEIRTMMERSSRFISLSGLSGIFAGLFALIGAAAAIVCLNIRFPYGEFLINDSNSLSRKEVMYFFFADASTVLLASFVVSIWLTFNRARQAGLPVFNSAARRLFINMFVPLVSGGIFCLIAYFKYGYVGFIAPLMLLIYGLSLLNASKYTLDDVRYLAYAEIVLGLLAFYYIGYGLIFWSIGFGIMHIIYGVWMWNKYERKAPSID
ncbi:MAG: hypothetical protein IPO27_17735 [Bacteroidetes bacterium]|nr:hypothetical protein [Bacteroidota bacterium]